MMSLTHSVARALNTLYFAGSSVYCLLGYSSFANEQFIRPQLIEWLPGLVGHHHELFWLTVVVTLPTLVPMLRRGTPRVRLVTATYLGLNLAVGFWLTANPVLSMVGSDDRTLTLAFLCLLPPLALAGVDHVTVPPPVVRRVDDRRLFVALATAAVLVWVTYVLLIAWYAPRMPGVDLAPAALAVAIGVSLVSHLLLFALVYLVVSAVLSVASLARHPLAEYLGPVGIVSRRTGGGASTRRGRNAVVRERRVLDPVGLAQCGRGRRVVRARLAAGCAHERPWSRRRGSCRNRFPRHLVHAIDRTYSRDRPRRRSPAASPGAGDCEPPWNTSTGISCSRSSVSSWSGWWHSSGPAL